MRNQGENQNVFVRYGRYVAYCKRAGLTTWDSFETWLPGFQAARDANELHLLNCCDDEHQENSWVNS